MAGSRRSIHAQDWKNETVIAWEKVKLKGEKQLFTNSMYTLMNSTDSDVPVNGCIIVSDYRFFFHAISLQYRNSVFYTPSSPVGAVGLNVDLPLGAIADVRKQAAGSNVYGFDLICKGFRPNLRFRFGDGEKKLTEDAISKDCVTTGKFNGIINLLQSLVFCEIQELFAFKNREMNADNIRPMPDMMREYKRLGILEKSSEWKVNKYFLFNKTL